MLPSIGQSPNRNQGFAFNANQHQRADSQDLGGGQRDEHNSQESLD